MPADKIKVLNIPLFPYLKPGQEKILPTKRIKPIDSLNLKKMIKEINKSTFIPIAIIKCALEDIPIHTIVT
jgi:hypothetical protein